MKATILTILAAASLITSQAFAGNRVEKPVWQCALSFQAKGGGLQVIVGKFELSGPGKVSCVDVAGNTQKMDVKVTLGGSPVALNVGFGKFEIAGVATGIGVSTTPEALMGKYYVANAQAALLAGAGASFSVHAADRGEDEALTLNVGVSMAKGTGLQLGVTKMKIELL